MARLGTIQRRVLRAFIAKPDAVLTTGYLVGCCYPRLKGKRRSRHYFCVRRAAETVADRAGIGWKGSILWRAKPSHLLPK